jgi:adenosine deaminase
MVIQFQSKMSSQATMNGPKSSTEYHAYMQLFANIILMHAVLRGHAMTCEGSKHICQMAFLNATHKLDNLFGVADNRSSICNKYDIHLTSTGNTVCNSSILQPTH